MTIEELAARAAVATTTVRMYQTRGLLPPPRRDGRIGRYGPGHLARLHLIGRLQERGFSLAGIQSLVETWEAGRGLDDLLGLEGGLPGLDVPTDVREVSAEELMAGFPEGALTPDVIQRSAKLGLVQLTDDGRFRVQPRFLGVGAALAAMGIPIDELLDEQAALDEAMDVVAVRFARLFERHIWHDFVAAGMPADRLGEISTLLRQLTQLASTVVDESLQSALRRVTEQFVASSADETLHP
jgi:DNA-binding transcriptional MerR regulator